LSPRELIEAGVALYGANWRSELARRLGLPDDSQIRAVEQGRLRAPAAWRGQIIALAQDAALRAMDVASSLIWRDRGDEDALPARAEAPQLI